MKPFSNVLFLKYTQLILASGPLHTISIVWNSFSLQLHMAAQVLLRRGHITEAFSKHLAKELQLSHSPTLSLSLSLSLSLTFYFLASTVALPH